MLLDRHYSETIKNLSGDLSKSPKKYCHTARFKKYKSRICF